MAANNSNTGGSPNHPRPRHPLRKHGEKEMGYQLGFHGVLRLCYGSPMLGRVGFPHVIRGKTRVFPRKTGCCIRREVLAKEGICGVLANGDDGVFPVGIRGHHGGFDSRIAFRQNELSCMDIVRAIVVYVFVYDCSFLHMVSSRMVGKARRYRFRRRICYSPFGGSCRFHCSFLGKQSTNIVNKMLV